MPTGITASRSIAFLAGLCSGAALLPRWRSLAKEGVKAGIRAQATLQAVAVKGLENLRDVTEEARWELTSEQRGFEGADAPAPGANGNVPRQQDRPTLLQV